MFVLCTPRDIKEIYELVFISNGVCGQTLNIIAKLAGVRFMFGGGGRLVD